ncbi:MAG: enoyl-CoA hydratase/isomerase family protein [Natronomonas sp.]|jgi:enoyl-CoA hydratase/3-hydroxyacyl-CoA dehydrogenase|uniref:enoyl-CoA hydratase/isomerase family protein n=1 Tax=Natronomonas sp. TaxID=2184060 RepID=UPI0028707AD0|nr:enoyl-CoA hydratase/isomerase family protein [Natronomonas sp.]MDR9430751.1 enoyl-CoA hydratase/isomerase family protein [Natronomonas sp.]
METVGTGLATVDRDGHRADVYLSRPARRNAMTAPLIEDVIAAFEAVDRGDVRAITLLGEGPVFCAGMDLEHMRRRVEADDGAPDPLEALSELIDAIEATRRPVVVGIKRAAVAGAFELTLGCDFRVLGSEASYGVPEVELGTFPHVGATQRLPRLVGLSKAKEIVLTGEYVPPSEALECGLVHEVCAPDAVDDRARAFADRLCENAPLGVQHGKRALDEAFERSLEDGLAFERELGRELDDTRDYREGFDARIEGREPAFEGE